MNCARLLRTLLAAAAGSGAALGGAGAMAQQAVEISVLIPSLSGRKGLSESVTTIMGLQVWQTLRRTDGGKGPEHDFGRGTVKDALALPSLTHRTAEDVAHHASFLSQMVLWGTVQDYGGGAIVEAYLSLPVYARLNDSYFADFRRERKEEWVVRARAGARQVEFRRDVPRRRIAFEPIVIAPAVVRNYSSYDALQLYDPADPNYNRLVKLPYAASHETMWMTEPLYDLVVVIGYNTDPVVPGCGSAIFLHVAREDFTPTAGCIAIPREALARLLGLLGPGSTITIRA